MTSHAEDIAYLSATEQVRLFQSRELSPVEVLRAQAARADALSETVNAFTWRFTEQALAQAREAEARYLGKGPAPRPLEGITLAIKEEMAVQGQPQTSASRVYAEEIADHSSPLASRVMAAGAIVARPHHPARVRLHALHAIGDVRRHAQSLEPRLRRGRVLRRRRRRRWRAD